MNSRAWGRFIWMKNGTKLPRAGLVFSRLSRSSSSSSLATEPLTPAEAEPWGGDEEAGSPPELVGADEMAPSRCFSPCRKPSLAPASSSRRRSGPLPCLSPASGPLSQLSHSGLLVGPSPSPAPSPANGPRGRGAGGVAVAPPETAGSAVAARGKARLGVPFAC
ncbi:hypothetical protein SEVIR_4G216450v4 [Setaria viridis]